MWSAGCGRIAGPALLGLLLVLLVPDGGTSKTSEGLVTCGSVLKLLNTHHKVRLHSHDIKYGSGSGQQSVTGVEASDDANSYWRIRGGSEGGCPRGIPVRCGQAVRLTHVLTGKNLHTHHFLSPLSNNQAKFICAVQGELNQCNSMGALEMHQRLEQLKRSIHRVHLYSQDAKKRKRKPKLKKPEPILFRDQSTSPCLSPTLLPPPATTVASVLAPSPPVYTMPRVFGPFSPLPSKSVSGSVPYSRLSWEGQSLSLCSEQSTALPGP